MSQKYRKVFGELSAKEKRALRVRRNEQGIGGVECGRGISRWYRRSEEEPGEVDYQREKSWRSQNR